MIDYYLKKHCPLGIDKNNPRCRSCVWLNNIIRKCIFSLDYPLVVTIQEFKERLEMVDGQEQSQITNPKKRFVTDEQADKDAEFWLENAPHELKRYEEKR